MIIIQKPQKDAQKSQKDRRLPYSRRRFFKHFARNFAIGLTITLLFIIIGMIGFMFYEGVNLVDAYTTSAMIISGVGPLFEPTSDQGKLFLGTYALFSGIGFLIGMGIILAPIFRWIFRQVHVADWDE